MEISKKALLRSALFLLVWLLHFSFQGSGPGNMTLWYDEPASNWNEALLIGNGRIGAMVFGNTQQEKHILSACSK